MGQVDGGDFKEGLQLRLMDPSTGGPYSAWYKFKGSEIVKIQKAGTNRKELARFSLEIDAARRITEDAVRLATGLDAPDGLRAGKELPQWVPGSLNLRGLFTGGFSLYKGYVSYDGGTLFCNLGVQYYTFDGSKLLLDKGKVPKMMKPTVAAEQTVAAARAMRDEVVKDDAYLGRLHKRDRERDVARGAEPPPPPPSRRRWGPKKTWDAYVARGEREPRPTPRRWPRPTPRPRGRPTPRPRGPPKLATKHDPFEELKWGASYRLLGVEEAVDVLYTKKSGTEVRALAAFSILSQYEDDGPEDGNFEGIDVRSELKARAEGVDVFIYEKDQGAPFDGGVEIRWESWTASKIYLAPQRDEENAVAVVTLKKHNGNFEGRSGHAYALVKPKAGGDRRDFEFANPAVLVVARD